MCDVWGLASCVVDTCLSPWCGRWWVAMARDFFWCAGGLTTPTDTRWLLYDLSGGGSGGEFGVR